MNPLKAPPSLLCGFGVPMPASSSYHNHSNYNNTNQKQKSRTVSFGGETDLFKKTLTSAADGVLPSSSSSSSSSAYAREAALLLSFSSIAENEIKAMGTKPMIWDDDDEDEADAEYDLQDFPKLPLFSSMTPATAGGGNNQNTKPGLWKMKMGPRPSTTPLQQTDSSSSEDDDEDEDTSDASYIDTKYQQKRLRSVSIDCPLPESPVMFATSSARTHTTTGLMGGGPNLVSPLSTPVLVKATASGKLLPGRKARGRQSQKAKRERRPSQKAAAAKKASAAAAALQDDHHQDHHDDSKRSLKAVSVPKGKTIKTILRKKFSWKNYPELEAFLIANREEYLRHSALNYTVQQKQYNNRLTERLLELAAEHGYVFDDVEFSFVTVRDRIRCYFKSYVQSAKKRGVIIGYAARKAGLLTTNELEKSACKTGKITG